MTSFSLPWYAITGAQAGVKAGLPVLGVLLLAVVGPAAGRYYIVAVLPGPRGGRLTGPTRQ